MSPPGATPGLCRAYAKGNCRFGDKCRYTHVDQAAPGTRSLLWESGDTDLDNSWATQIPIPAKASKIPTTNQRNDTKNEVCRNLKNGSCKFGSRCRFSHEVSPEVRHDQHSPDVSIQPIVRIPRSKPCFKWATGTCKKGDRCEYYHDPETPERLKCEKEVQRIQAEFHARLEAEERQREEEQRLLEERRRDDERRRLEREEIQARREAERQRQREEQRARREAEIRRQKEEQRARREAELVAKREEQHRVEAATTVTREVDGCIVTFSAGLAVNNIVAGFDVTRGRLTNLPLTVQVSDIEAVFLRHGFDQPSFVVGKPQRSPVAFVSIASRLTPRLDQLPSIQGANPQFVPFKNNLADGDTGTSTAFSRTVSVQVIRRHSDPVSVLDALHDHLQFLVPARRPRATRRETASAGSNTRVTFFVEFDTWDAARAFRDALVAQKLFRYSTLSFLYQRIFLPSKYTYPVFIPAAQYSVQKTQWDELAESCKEARCELKVRDFPDGKVRLNVHGDAIEDVGPLKVRAEQLARGTTLDMWNRRLFDQATARKLTNDIRDMTGALVEVDIRIRGLRAYGPAAAVERARAQLQLYAEELASREYAKDLTSTRTVRFFIEVAYPQLRETYGEDAVTLDLVSVPKRITVTGDEEIRHRLDTLFAESFTDWSSQKDAADGEHTCPICMCPATAPSALGCGHVYCTECLTHFVRSALESTAFPLRCSGADGRCGAPLAIAVLERFLHAGKFQQLLEAAFHAHVAQHPDALRPCRTPGCTQLYARSTRADGSAAVRCPACFARACAACDAGVHAGQTCAEAARDPSEDYIASAASGIRRCPRCSVPIFKDGGCQHVSCRCGAHVCWRCLAAFDGSTACYAHMREAHGGIFEQDMVDADPLLPGRAPARAPDLPFEHVAPAMPGIPAAFIEEDRLARAQAAREQARRTQLEDNRRRVLEMRQRYQEIGDADRGEDDWLARARAVRERAREQQEDRRRQEDNRRRILEMRQRDQEAWEADHNRRWGEVDRVTEEAARLERARRETERAREQERGGGWCVVM